jgi:hypothetical protein
MILYHGSDVVVARPEIRPPSHTLDFGTGFYTTTNLDQARTFANIVYHRNERQSGRFVSVYELNEPEARAALKIKEFYGVDDEWFDFVYQHRMDKFVGETYDLTIGAVANDTVYRTFIAYENGILSKVETIARLRIRDLYNQYVFNTAAALSYLRYTGFEEL